MKQSNILLSGWALREWDIEPFIKYLLDYQPSLIEISKDFVENGKSIKIIKKRMDDVLYQVQPKYSFVGTSDIGLCHGFEFSTYLRYLQIQIAEAKFLNCKYFRIMVKKTDLVPPAEIISRIQMISTICNDLLVEIHNGWESNGNNIDLLIRKTTCNFIIDFQNLSQLNKLSSRILRSIPQSRIAYFHTRNLRNVYIEDASSLETEQICEPLLDGVPVLWEPKKLSANEIQTIYSEYRRSVAI